MKESYKLKLPSYIENTSKFLSQNNINHKVWQAITKYIEGENIGKSYNSGTFLINSDKFSLMNKQKNSYTLQYYSKRLGEHEIVSGSLKKCQKKMLDVINNPNYLIDNNQEDDKITFTFKIFGYTIKIF